MANSIMKMAFVINGSLGHDFTSSIGRAQEQLQKLQHTIRVNNRALDLAKKKPVITEPSAITKRAEELNNLNKKINTAHQSYRKFLHVLNKRNNAQKAFSTAKLDFFSTLQTVGPLTSAFTDAYETAANFEKAMSKVGAISLGDVKGDEYNRQLKILTDTARRLGEKTQFTATQSAEAMSYLGMAGWKTNQIIEGMPALLDLAVAGGADLARTADIISDELTAFGLGADKARHMADVFAVTITSTNTDVEKLGETMKYAAPVAYAFGASMEETAAMAGLMAGKAIKASLAGTALRTGLMRLAGPPKMAQKAMDELGLSMEDLTAEQKEAAMALKTLGIETGNTAGAQKMAIILNSLREKMAGLTDEEKTAMAAAVFGKNAAAGWLAMIDAEEGAFEKLLDSLYKSEGASARVAQRMNANAKGAATRMKSAWESLQISLMNGFLPLLADVFDTAAKAVGGISKLASEFPTLAKVAVGGSAAITGFFLAFSAANLAYHGYKFAMTGLDLWIKGIVRCNKYLQLQKLASIGLEFALGKLKTAYMFINGLFATTPIGVILLGVTALIVAGTLLYKHWDKVKTFFTNLWNSPTAKLLMFVTGPIGWLVAAVSAIIANWDTLKEYFEYFWDNPEAALFRFQNWVQESFQNAVKAGEQKWNELKAVLDKPIFATFIAPAWDSFKNAASAAFENVKAKAGAAFDGVKTTISGAIDSAVDTVMNLPGNVARAAGFAAGYLFESLTQLPGKISSLVARAGQFLSDLPQACLNAGIAFVNNLASWGTQAWNTATNFFSNLVDSTIDFLTRLPEICSEAGAAFLNRLTTWGGEAFGATVAFLTNLVKAAASFLWNLPTICMGAGRKFVSAAAQWAEDAYNSIMEWITKLPEAISNTISNAWENIKSKFSAGFTVGVSAAAQNAAPVAENAKGGIYNRGAFLTTFAEKSPEAAIPIDNSDRAKGLWLRVGRMLGMVQQPKGRTTTPVFRLPGTAPAQPSGYEPTPVMPDVSGIFGALLKKIRMPKPERTETKIPDISMPSFPEQPTPIVNTKTVLPELAPVFSPIIRAIAPAVTPIVNAMAAVPELKPVFNAVTKTPDVSVAVPTPENKQPEQKQPVFKNIIQAVADSPIVKTFVNAIADVPELIFRPEMKPVFIPQAPIVNAMAATPDVAVTSPAVTPIVNATASAPNVNVASPAAPVVNAMAATPDVNVASAMPNVAPIIQAMATTPNVTALFDPTVQGADMPDINLPDLPVQKETLIERIKEFVTSTPARTQAAPTFVVNNEFHFTGQANEKEIRDTVDRATDITAAKFRELMQQYLREERRLSYG